MTIAAIVVLGQSPEVSSARSEVDRVLLRAESAFEYRDFEKVVGVLMPWVHPPRIADRERMLKARALLGVSLHLLGDIDSARLQFERVLETDFEHKLDPFRVPPAVIDSFEDVRSQMKPPQPVVPVPLPRAVEPAWADADHAAVLKLMPFGLPQLLVTDQPEWGLGYLAIQVVGLVANIAGYWLAYELRKDDGFIPVADQTKYDIRLGIQYGGLGAFVLGWLSSGIHAFAYEPLRTEAAARF